MAFIQRKTNFKNSIDPKDNEHVVQQKLNKSTEDRGWRAMSVLLDKTAGKQTQRRLVLWLWPVAASVIGAVLYFSISNGLDPQLKEVAVLKTTPMTVASTSTAIFCMNRQALKFWFQKKENWISNNRTNKGQTNNIATADAALLSLVVKEPLPKAATTEGTIQNDAVQNSEYTIEANNGWPRVKNRNGRYKKHSRVAYNLNYQKKRHKWGLATCNE